MITAHFTTTEGSFAIRLFDAEVPKGFVVLKGEDSLVAAPGRGVLISALGPPSLSTAGTGDVLTGITAAFLAKRPANFTGR